MPRSHCVATGTGFLYRGDRARKCAGQGASHAGLCDVTVIRLSRWWPAVKPGKSLSGTPIGQQWRRPRLVAPPYRPAPEKANSAQRRRPVQVVSVSPRTSSGCAILIQPCKPWTPNQSRTLLQVDTGSLVDGEVASSHQCEARLKIQCVTRACRSGWSGRRHRVYNDFSRCCYAYIQSVRIAFQARETICRRTSLAHSQDDSL